MNKLLISCLFVCSMCISQTGMVTAAGESGFGAWLNASVINIEYDEADPTYALSLGYMMDNGLEIGLNYWLETGWDWNPIDLKVLYHIKDDTNMNFAFGIQIANITEADAEDDWYYYETESSTIVGGGGYTSDLFSFEVSHNLDADDAATSIAIGKMFDLGGLNVGVGYSANTEWLDEGWITLSLGSTF